VVAEMDGVAGGVGGGGAGGDVCERRDGGRRGRGEGGGGAWAGEGRIGRDRDRGGQAVVVRVLFLVLVGEGGGQGREVGGGGDRGRYQCRRRGDVRVQSEQWVHRRCQLRGQRGRGSRWPRPSLYLSTLSVVGRDRTGQRAEGGHSGNRRRRSALVSPGRIRVCFPFLHSTSTSALPTVHPQHTLTVELAEPCIVGQKHKFGLVCQHGESPVRAGAHRPRAQAPCRQRLFH